MVAKVTKKNSCKLEALPRNFGHHRPPLPSPARGDAHTAPLAIGKERGWGCVVKKNWQMRASKVL